MKNYMNLSHFRSDVETALKELGIKYGVEIKGGNISYDNNSLTMQLKAVRTDIDVQKDAFLRNVRYMRGFSADDYLRKVQIDKKNYVITGFKPGNKYSVILVRDDGREYVYTADAVLNEMNKGA